MHASEPNAGTRIQILEPSSATTANTMTPAARLLQPCTASQRNSYEHPFAAVMARDTAAVSTGSKDFGAISGNRGVVLGDASGYAQVIGMSSSRQCLREIPNGN